MGGFSQAFVDADWEVIRIDIEKKFKPSIVADIRYLPLKENLNPEVLLISPPCERFSIAMPQWPKMGIKKAMELVGAAFEAVAYLKPKFWLIENPMGRLRWFLGKPGKTIRYSDFDFKYVAQKKTDLWGNLPLPMAKVMRKLYIGHYEKGWFATYISRKSSERAKIPIGVSKAILEGIV